MNSIDYGGNERKRGCKENRNPAACAHLKNQRTHTRCKQRNIAVQPGEQRHKHQRTEGDKQHLCAEKPVPEPETIDDIIVGHEAYPLGNVFMSKHFHIENTRGINHRKLRLQVVSL